jgi:hypothetical protein
LDGMNPDEVRIRINLRGYKLDGQTICMGCVTEDELKDLVQKGLPGNMLLTAGIIGDDLVFCDRCKKQMEGSLQDMIFDAHSVR